MSTYILAFATALLASVSLTPTMRRLALRLGVMDLPGPRKLHLAPVPMLGGLAIYIAFIFGVLVFIANGAVSQVVGILGGSTLLVVMGILDDRRILHPQVKLMVAMPAAALILLASGIHARVFTFASYFTTGGTSWSLTPWLIVDYAITLLWVVGITASFNILDHMDGLCAGIAAVAAAFFLVLALMAEQFVVVLLAASLLGASLGFLFWNFNPAKIFMGDGGAMFLGFMLATLGLKLSLPVVPEITRWMIPVFVLAVPIFDTTLITVSRTRRGLLPFASPGKDHVAHRLANLGLGQGYAVLILLATASFFGLLAILVCRFSIGQSYALAGLLFLAGIFAIVALELAPFEKQRRANPG